jgi:hypothetical protein
MTNRPGDARFYALIDEIAALHGRKSLDYAPQSDPLANFKGSMEFGLRPYLGILTRLRDKWGRICQLAQGATAQNESVRDSHIDSAVYHLLAVLLLEDESHLSATVCESSHAQPETMREFVESLFTDPLEPVEDAPEVPVKNFGRPMNPRTTDVVCHASDVVCHASDVVCHASDVMCHATEVIGHGV